MNIILPINPKHVRKIISGKKKYEYRTRIPKNPVDKIVIYETAPTKKIVAEAEIIEIISLPPKTLWEETKDFSGITKEFFDQYFKNKDIAYAYKLGKIKVYDTPLDLSDFGLKSVPQSFVYLSPSN